MTKAKRAAAKTEKVISSEETIVTINTIAYFIPRDEEVEVPSDVADLLRDAGFIPASED